MTRPFLLALVLATTLAADTRVVSFAGHPAQIADISVYPAVAAGSIGPIRIHATIAQIYSEPSGDTAVNLLGYVEFDLTKEGGAQFAEMVEGIVAAKWAQQNPAMPLRERRKDLRQR